jgi:hypothetical protein
MEIGNQRMEPSPSFTTFQSGAAFPEVIADHGL